MFLWITSNFLDAWSVWRLGGGDEENLLFDVVGGNLS